MDLERPRQSGRCPVVAVFKYGNIGIIIGVAEFAVDAEVFGKRAGKGQINIVDIVGALLL